MPTSNENPNYGLGAQLGVAGLGGLAGAFPTVGSSSGTSTSQNNTTQQGSSNTYNASDINSLLQTLSNLTSRNTGTTTSTPTLGGPQESLMDQLTRQYSNLAGSNQNLAPYAAQQTQMINRNSNLQSQAVQNAMAARGLSTSPVSGTAEANIQAQRVGQISNMLSGIPLLQQQLKTQNLGAAGGFLSSIPRAMTGTTDATSTQVGDTSQQGKTTGVQTSDTNSTNNTQSWAKTIQEQATKQGGGIGGFLGGLVPLLASILIP